MNMKLILTATLLALTGCATGKFKTDQASHLNCGMPEKDVEALVGAPYQRWVQDDGSQIWYWATQGQIVSMRMNKGKVVELPLRLPKSDPLEWKKRAHDCLARTHSPKIAEAISSEVVLIGMSTSEALSSWGVPQKNNRTVSANVTHEQWVYPGDKYLYFENGHMTSFQDSH